MDAHGLLVGCLLGASTILFFQGMVESFFVFYSNYGKMFYLCVTALLSGMVFLVITIASTCQQDASILVALSIPFWFVMIQSTTIAYAIRIKGMGGYTKMDKYVKWIAPLLFVFQIPASTLYLLNSYTQQYQQEAVLMGISLSVVISISEVGLFVVLLKKIMYMLEYRPTLKKVLAAEMSFFLVLFILIDIGLLVSKIVSNKYDPLLRGFSYIFRIKVLVRFYQDLLTELKDTLPLSDSFS